MFCVQLKQKKKTKTKREMNRMRKGTQYYFFMPLILSVFLLYFYCEFVNITWKTSLKLNDIFFFYLWMNEENREQAASKREKLTEKERRRERERIKIMLLSLAFVLFLDFSIRNDWLRYGIKFKLKFIMPCLQKTTNYHNFNWFWISISFNFMIY